MPKNKSAIILLPVSVILLVVFSCIKGPFTSSDFRIKVDSVQVPDTIRANTPFSVEFYGTIGFDGCFSFKTFTKSIQDSVIVIEAWGTYEKNVETCPQEIVTLNGQKLIMAIPLPGKYRIVVKEPDYSAYVKRITVMGLIPE